MKHLFRMNSQLMSRIWKLAIHSKRPNRKDLKRLGGGWVLYFFKIQNIQVLRQQDQVRLPVHAENPEAGPPTENVGVQERDLEADLEVTKDITQEKITTMGVQDEEAEVIPRNGEIQEDLEAEARTIAPKKVWGVQEENIGLQVQEGEGVRVRQESRRIELGVEVREENEQVEVEV